MSATRGLRLSALAGMIFGATLAPVTASAQAMDPIFEHFGIGRESETQSQNARLVGLGSVTMVSDRNNHLTLWDFARNPAGLYIEDTTSTIDIRPGTGSWSGSRTGTASGGDGARQVLGARTNIVSYELFRRTPRKNAYGFYGSLAGSQVETPFGAAVGRERFQSTPGGSLVLDGPFPLLRSGKLIYSMRVSYLRQSSGENYRTYVENPTGEYLDIGGDDVGPPNFFDPDRNTTTVTGLGASFAYDFGPWLIASIGGDVLQTKIRSANDDVRYESSRDGTRPYGLGQATFKGSIGPAFQWIADGRLWQASNEERWNFTLAAGIQQLPLAGRGTLLKRYEEGSQLRTQARWTSGPFELNGEVGTWYQQVRVTPPAIDDRTSFNYFRNTIPERQNTDSLVIADSVVKDVRDLRDLHYAFGGTWRGMEDRALLAAEFHSLRQVLDQLTTGNGPERLQTDLRTGLEYRCTPRLTARLGYVFRLEDLDDLTERNEFVRQSLTAGFSVRPRNARWDVGLAGLHEWSRPDFDSPTDLRETRQHVAMQVRWEL